MKRLPYIILSLVAAAVVACSHGPHQRQLAQVDSLMTHSLHDSAYQVFKQIDYDEFGNEADRMHYDLWKAVLAQNPDLHDSILFDEPRDSVLRKCIDYYQQSNDPRKLLYSYLYVGKLYLKDRDKNQDASANLKRAEELLPKVNDLRLAYLTNEALSTLNYYSGNEDLALDYSYKTLNCAKQSNSTSMLYHAYNHLVVLYMACNESDSVRKYNDCSMSILNKMTPKNRAVALNNLASNYINSKHLDSAYIYIQRAYDEYPAIFLNQKLAIICYRRGEYAKADSLWQQALQSHELRDRAETYSYMLDEKYNHHDYEGASLAAMHLIEAKDSLADQMKTVEVLEIQKKYDKEVERRKLDRFMMWSLVAALVVLTLIAAGVIYHIRRANRAREHMMRDQVLLNDYQRQIEELERSGEDTSKDIQTLRMKMDTLQAQQTEKLSEGRALYQHLVAGESAVAWSKEQIQKFIEYYKVVNLPFMLQMESDYARLSPGNRFFLILQDMGMSDEQMTHILGVSDGALRTTRSRLRQKRATTSNTNA